MSFLTPLFLALGLLAGPIIVLYMLRLRRQEMVVSSTLLWQKLLRDREANAPWQKLRRNLLLLLQLLILGFLVFALARPFFPVPSITGGSMVVVLDGSASMQATDVAPSRFAEAQAEVERLINELGAGDKMTLILAGPTPVVLAGATDDRRTLHSALQSAQAAPTSADWPATLALAAGALQGVRDARLVIVSDGGLPSELPPLPAETLYVPVGESGENLAITALATRNGDPGSQLFAGVRNTGDAPQEGVLSIRMDETLTDSAFISLLAGEAVNLTWDLPAEVTTISAELSEQTEDHFALDDMAWAVNEGGVNNRVLVVTPGNVFLEQLYTVLPGIQAFRATPDSDVATSASEPYDLYVFDSVPAPAALPGGDLMLINPQAGAPGEKAEDPLLTVGGVFTNTKVTQIADSALLQFIDWSGVDVRQAQSISAPWAQPLISSEGGPLLLVGERDGIRVAILAFDLHDSDLPLQIAFPVLMANLTDWLNPGQVFDAPTGLGPGNPIGIRPGADTTHILIDRPDGTTWIAPASEEATIFAETWQPGIYTTRLRDERGDRIAGKFAVNTFSPIESVISPAAFIQVGPGTPVEDGQENIGQKEVWPWLAAAAVFILIVEWWVYFQGARLPQFRKSSS